MIPSMEHLVNKNTKLNITKQSIPAIRQWIQNSTTLLTTTLPLNINKQPSKHRTFKTILSENPHRPKTLESHHNCSLNNSMGLLHDGNEYYKIKLIFSTNTMDPVLLKEQISECIQDIPVSLCWKMINMGTQGKVKDDDQVQVLHLCRQTWCKDGQTTTMTLYTSQSEDHAFPLHIQMWLVPEINLVLNLKRRKNVEKLYTCQNTWNQTKFTFIKTWEIELLDSTRSRILWLLLQDAMMSIWHPTNGKFALFHSIDKLWWETFYVLMVLKLAELYAHAMILSLLPYLQ